MDIRVRQVRFFKSTKSEEESITLFLTVRFGHWRWNLVRTFAEVQVLHSQASKILKKDVLPNLPELEADYEALRPALTTYFGELTSAPQIDRVLNTFIGRATVTSECKPLTETPVKEGFMKIRCDQDDLLNGDVLLYCMAVEDTIYFFEKFVVAAQPCDLPLGSICLTGAEIKKKNESVVVSYPVGQYEMICASSEESESWWKATQLGSQHDNESTLLAELSPQQQRAVVAMSEQFPDADEAQLIRFLAFNQWDVDQSIAIFQADLQWREDVRIDDIKINSIYKNIQSGRLVYTNTKDKLGRPILVFRASLHSANIDFMDTLVPSMYLIERAIEDSGDAQEFVMITDLSGFDKQNNDFRMIKLAAEMIMAHYPGRVGAIWGTSTSWFFRTIFRVIKSWLGDELLGRVHLFGGTSELLDYVDKDQLPSDLGGTATIDMQAWASERAKIEGVSLAKLETHHFANEEIVAAFSDAPASHTADGCTYEGWMKKQGGFVKKFNKRYCVLKGTILYYYRDEGDLKADGVVFLREATLVADKTETFHIITSGRKDCVFQLLDKKQPEWLKVLETVIVNHGGSIGESEGDSAPVDPVDSFGSGWDAASKAKKAKKATAAAAEFIDELFLLYQDESLRRFPDGRVPGNSLVDALLKVKPTLSRSAAVAVAQSWIQQWFLFPLSGKSDDFVDSDSSLFMLSFLSDTRTLNLARFLRSPVEESGEALVRRLHSQLVAVIQANTNAKGRVDFAAIRASRAFFDFLLDTSALQLLSLEAVEGDRAAFFFNVRSLLLLHAQVESGADDSCEARWELNSAQYCIGMNRYSLSDLGHGLLRANSNAPESILAKHFQDKKDPRLKFALKSSDERVVFALQLGLTLDVFHFCEDFEETLKEASSNFVSKFVSLKAGEVWVSVILTWVNEPNRLAFLERFLPDKSSLAGYRVVLQNVDWSKFGLGSLLKSSSSKKKKKKGSRSKSGSAKNSGRLSRRKKATQ